MLNYISQIFVLWTEAPQNEGLRDEGGFTHWLHEQHISPAQRSAPSWGFCRTTRQWFYGTLIQIWIRESLPRCLSQSYLIIYVPMSPWTITPMIHVAVPSLIRQSIHRLTQRWPLTNRQNSCDNSNSPFFTALVQLCAQHMVWNVCPNLIHICIIMR